MCGIFGSVADKVEYNSIKQGLKNLAYRGYDSAGIAVATSQGIVIERAEGHPKFLPRSPSDITAGQPILLQPRTTLIPTPLTITRLALFTTASLRTTLRLRDF